jgi:ABC-type sugar transport system ATPase subunit
LPFFSAGILALLDEPTSELKEFALKKLLTPYTSTNDRGLSILDVFWAEISEALPR